MLRTMAKVLPVAAHVTEQLLTQYGPELIWQVERLSPHIFRAWMNDGRILLVTALDEGGISIKEMEAPA